MKPTFCGTNNLLYLMQPDFGFGQLYLGWTAGADWPSRMIQANDRVYWEGQWYPSAVNHVLWLFVWRHEPALIYESHLGHGVRIKPYSALQAAMSRKQVVRAHFRYMTDDPGKMAAVWTACGDHWGRTYDKWQIIKLLAWIRFYGRDKTARPWPWNWKDNLHDICSELTQPTGLAGGFDLCGKASTPATTTPESQFLTLTGQPSAVFFGLAS
jgi:hypothetical protein